MRRNLVRMLDDIGLHEALGIGSTASLFGEHQDLADTSSMCSFTVLRGSPGSVDTFDLS